MTISTDKENRYVPYPDEWENRLTVRVRKNASQKTIDRAVAQLEDEWEWINSNKEDLFISVPTALLYVGDTCRYGYHNGYSSWGYSEREVEYSIAGQKEYAWREQGYTNP